LGNEILSDTTANGKIKSLGFTKEELIEDSQFIFALKTGKGNFILKESSWYSNDGKSGLAFSNLIFEKLLYEK